MFNKDIVFKHPWRDYQQDVIDRSQDFLSDGHIHVVAAPGSGKTVLGLELMRRLDKPTIILAPTLSIRNQWVDRFTELFLQVGSKPAWISTDIRKPAKMTVVTYQALYSGLKDVVGRPSATESSKGQKLIDQLNTIGVKTIIVDEAHHLRNEWWKSLNTLKLAIKDPTVVALTATPPYDSSSGEWKKYQNFCGPIDIEVSVPALVERGDLCPHQDYVHFSELTIEESAAVDQIEERQRVFAQNLLQNQELINALAQHKVVSLPKQHERTLFDDTLYFSAVGSYLYESGNFKPAKQMMKYITGGSHDVSAPEFNKKQLETLLTGLLFKDTHFSNSHPDLHKKLDASTRRVGAVQFRTVLLRESIEESKITRNSYSKLNGVLEVVAHEYAVLAGDLSCVVLTDYIRKDSLPEKNKPLPELNKIGVIPIFEKLRRDFSNTATDKIAILSGSILVLPVTLKADFKAALKKSSGLKTPRVTFHQYSVDERYIMASVTDLARQYVVAAMTSLFEDKKIRVLVGTRALLGEGWDAPSMNSLLLASVVGSFMLSNQMRGRAIRTSASSASKVSNIWHFATVSPINNSFKESVSFTQDLGSDVDTLQKRFKTFIGISAHSDVIESGFNRASFLKQPPYRVSKLSHYIQIANQNSYRAATDRDAVSQRWNRSLEQGSVKDIVHTVRTDKKSSPVRRVYYKSAAAIVISGLYTTQIYARSMPEIFSTTSRFGSDGRIVFFVILSVFLCWILYWLYGALLFAFKHRTSKESFRQLGICLAKSLTETKAIKTGMSNITIFTKRNVQGEISCGALGLTSYESDVFLDALQELLSPVGDPRYVLIDVMPNRFSKLLSFFKTKTYRAVPSLFGTHKKQVDIFIANWRTYVGPAHVMYTRSVRGRKLLLRARYISSDTMSGKQPTRHSIWE